MPELVLKAAFCGLSLPAPINTLLFKPLNDQVIVTRSGELVFSLLAIDPVDTSQRRSCLRARGPGWQTGRTAKRMEAHREMATPGMSGYNPQPSFSVFINQSLLPVSSNVGGLDDH